jgi:biotin transport system substrate-specific component
MHIANTIHKARLDVFAWRTQADLSLKITLAVGFAVLTGLFAQVRIPLPFTPVPVTGQTLAVLMAGIVLGRKWGGVSMVIYGVLGLAGIPWLTGGTSGLGATTGYIIGFVLAASFIGYLTDRYLKARNFFSLFTIMLFASFILVYVPGLLWLGAWLGLVMHKSATAGSLLSMGAAPFIAGDILKAAAAAGAAWLLLPKTTFGHAKDSL